MLSGLVKKRTGFCILVNRFLQLTDVLHFSDNASKSLLKMLLIP